MSILQTILIGVGLSMDAFAAALCIAASSENLRLKNMLVIAAFFGGFQALMPYLGWQASAFASAIIGNIGHWIAAVLLYYIGGKMIVESFKCKACEIERKSYSDPKNIYVLFMLSIATSIDALAVGVSLGCLKSAIALPAIIIGCTTFIITLLGAMLGERIGAAAGNRSEILGGAILALIATKILIEHLFFGH